MSKKILTVILLIIVICIFSILHMINYSEKQEKVKGKTASFIYGKNGKIDIQVNAKNEYETMPSEIKGHKVIGKLEIPSIDLQTYILEETTNQTLNISVTKLSGPQINKIGNFCITGHNYINSRMFFNLNKVKLNDEVILTDTFGGSIRYRVYETKEILPTEVDVLKQDTNLEKEVTLITCTFGARKRLIVKAIEEYD